MSRAVQFVGFEQVHPALVLILYGEICIEISVLVLCGGYYINKVIDLLFERGVREIGE